MFTQEYQTHYIIESDKNFPSLRRVRYNGTGSVDKSLRGLYTTTTEAMRAIDSFLRNKVRADADKTKPARGGKGSNKGPDNGSEPAGVPA